MPAKKELNKDLDLSRYDATEYWTHQVVKTSGFRCHMYRALFRSRSESSILAAR